MLAKADTMANRADDAKASRALKEKLQVHAVRTLCSESWMFVTPLICQSVANKLMRVEPKSRCVESWSWCNVAQCCMGYTC